MSSATKKAASPLLIVIAFAIVYIVWGSTYYFIGIAVHGFPALLMGALRFTTAGVLLLSWCVLRGERIWVKGSFLPAAITGLLLLVGGNGAVIWVEQKLPSAMVAILVSASPIWFVLLDKGNWRVNFKSKSTVAGLIIGFAGVILLFNEQLQKAFAAPGAGNKIPGMIMLVFGAMAWSAGSLYSKYRSSAKVSASVNTAWQMIIAGLVFAMGSLILGEPGRVQWQQIPAQSWYALIYLIVFGSLAAYSAYVWLLQVCPATQVSTYAYVNPVIAVILGVLFAHEKISVIQVIGLFIILCSVLLINLVKYRKAKPLLQDVQNNKVAATVD